jgi:pilus assembly protein CpaE
MKLTAKIVLATEQKDFAEKLQNLLSPEKGISLSNTCNDLAELRGYLDTANASIAIVDIDSDTHKKLQELDQMVPLYPKTRFAVACSSSSKELIIESMQAGARYFMHKQFLEAELDIVLERIIIDSAKTASVEGLVISVLSAGGGCGATTIALNLANELRLKSSQHILAIDLDEHYGAISSYLGVNSSYGISDVLNRKDRIDRQLIMSSATPYKDDFDILLSPASMSKYESINGNMANLTQALEACKTAYSYTIVDAPRVSRQLMQLLANVSGILVVVFQSNVKDIKTAKSIISDLHRFGIPSEKVFPIVNRFRCRFWFRGRAVPVDEAKKAMEINNIYTVRNDFKSVINCINRGQPLSESAPRSGVRRDLIKIAEEISNSFENGNSKVFK